MFTCASAFPSFLCRTIIGAKRELLSVDVYQTFDCASKYSVPVKTVVWGFSAALAVGACSTRSVMGSAW